MLLIKKEQIQQILRKRNRTFSSVEKTVSKIISDVERNGDNAVKRWTQKLDKISVNKIQVSDDEILLSLKKILPQDKTVINEAIKRITKYHKKQHISSFTMQEDGLSIKFRTKPVDRAGLYIPAGSAPLISTTLMTSIPAKVANVGEIIACSPPTYKGSIHPYIIGCLSMLGIKKIFKIGGSQAIAAMAFGTESVPKVNVIAGPGNIYVNAAKKLVSGIVGIDILAGPSELVVMADNSVNIDFVSADLNAQAEHKYSVVFFLCTDNNIGNKVSKKVKNGYWMKISNLEDGIKIINDIAPEHLQIICKNARSIAEKCVAGAIFIGNYTPCAIGDYIAGPSHTLPTGSTAAFDSGLSVFDFIRTYAIMEANSTFFKKNGIISERLAEIENLFKHRDSLKIRRL